MKCLPIFSDRILLQTNKERQHQIEFVKIVHRLNRVVKPARPDYYRESRIIAREKKIEHIHLVNAVSFNVSLNNDHQMVEY